MQGKQRRRQLRQGGSFSVFVVDAQSQRPPFLSIQVLCGEPATTGPLLFAWPCHWNRKKCSCSVLTMWNSGDLVADKLGDKMANE